MLPQSDPAPDVSVVIPAFNEAERIATTLAHVRRVLAAGPWSAEVVVVVDGATDGTAEIVGGLAAAAGPVPVRLLTRPENRGKGCSVRRGMLEARGRVRLFSDADLSTPIEMAAPFVAAVAAGSDIVIASRRLEGSRLDRRQPWLREQLGRAFSAVVSRVLLPGTSDSQCGFKAFTAASTVAVFERQRIDGFCFDVEVLVIARQLRLRILEHPVSWADDPRSRVRPLRDGLRMLGDVARIHLRRRRGEYAEMGPPSAT
ncbi:MAG: glycosyltransferase family 2 protein [Acidobacteria bacterium]|nr:glycosyltransferase family 2 protein [Acidobacteriota bacterium]